MDSCSVMLIPFRLPSWRRNQKDVGMPRRPGNTARPGIESDSQAVAERSMEHSRGGRNYEESQRKDMSVNA